MLRTSNPALGDRTFSNSDHLAARSGTMTVSGTVNKCFILLTIVIATAAYSWNETMPQSGWSAEGVEPSIPGWYWAAIIGTLILSLIIIFKQHTAPYLAPVYAAGEGILLGTISALFEVRYPGVVIQAVLCTTGVFAALLVAYKTKLIPVTDNFRLGVVAATGGVALVYIIDMLMRAFGINVPFLHENGTIGIVVSVVVIVIAALNLVLDFDFIEKGEDLRSPKYMEWYAAFGLLVTLVWLYLEILRLLGKARSR